VRLVQMPEAAQGHQRAHDAYLNEDHERRRPRVLDALLNFAEECGQLIRPESAERLEHGAVYQARGGPNSTTPRPPGVSGTICTRRTKAMHARTRSGSYMRSSAR